MPTKEKFNVYVANEFQGYILITIHDIPKNPFFWDVVRERIEAEIADMELSVDHVDFGGKLVKAEAY